jgi:hypothetical protein
MRADDQKSEITGPTTTSSTTWLGRWTSTAKLFVWTGAAVLLVSVYALFDFGVLRSEMTSYSAICHSDVTEVGHCARITSLMDRQIFRVWPDQQRVVVRSGSAVHRGECTVFDRTNWRCEYPNGDTVGSASGRIYRSLQEPGILEARRVDLSRWRYLALKWIGCGGEASDSRRCAWLAPG